MTFKDLKKKVCFESAQQKSRLFERLRDKPFWINDIEQHKQRDIETNGYCCFNHIIGLPKKDGKELRIFDYEQDLVNTLDNSSDIFVKKARGLGITEIILRYMSWLCVKD